MRVTIARTLGLAAFVAAARAAWLHHCDNQLVIRTDLMRESFAAGQAAERARAAEQATADRQARYFFPDVKSGSWQLTQVEGRPPMVTVLPPGMDEPDFLEADLGSLDALEEPEGPGWLEFGGPHVDPERASFDVYDDSDDGAGWHG